MAGPGDYKPGDLLKLLGSEAAETGVVRPVALVPVAKSSGKKKAKKNPASETRDVAEAKTKKTKAKKRQLDEGAETAEKPKKAKTDAKVKAKKKKTKAKPEPESESESDAETGEKDEDVEMAAEPLLDSDSHSESDEATAKTTATSPAATRKTKKAEGGKQKQAETTADLEPATAASGDKHDPEVAARTVFVGNVPLQVRSAKEAEAAEAAAEDGAVNLKHIKAELRKTFAAFGPVASVRLRSLPIEPTAVPQKSTYKTMMKVSAFKNKVDAAAASCNAYVVFREAASAERAIAEAHDAEFFGRHLRVDRVGSAAGAKTEFEPRKSVFLGNVHARATDEDVRGFFADNEEFTVQNLRVVRDRKTQTGKGIAFVLFTEPRMVSKALALNGSDLLGRPLRITRVSNSGPKDKGGKQKRGGPQRGRAAAPQSGEAPSLSFQGARATYTGAVAARRRIRNKVNKHRTEAQKKAAMKKRAKTATRK